MIKLTILYNLKPDAKEEAFLHWRLNEHQDANMSVPGVIASDFSKIVEAWPKNTTVPYRFMTNMYWPDYPSFQKGFYDPQTQADLQKCLSEIADPIFLVSEILVDASKEV